MQENLIEFLLIEKSLKLIGFLTAWLGLFPSEMSEFEEFFNGF
jgi:hypothetical protein